MSRAGIHPTGKPLEPSHFQVIGYLLEPVSHRLLTPFADMFTSIRGARVPSNLPRVYAHLFPLRPYSTSDKTSDRVPTNDPSPPKPVQNVSESNAVPISPQGLRDSDRPLQEMPEDSERQRVMQAPNRKEAWSRSQQPRERAMSGPRFEQTIMEYQVRDPWAAETPFRSRSVVSGDWLTRMGTA